MDFNFIPYRLNADIADFKDELQYSDIDNGIDLYKARKGLKTYLLGILLIDINLYFHEGKLITVYLQLDKNPENAGKVLDTLETAIGSQKRALKTNVGMVYSWTNESEFLGLVNDEKDKRLYLYYSLRKYSVF